ncbi:Uncharacterised protein [uncultured archaeon]|nr:Uncharacterised protein [uncultured archaeon]
MTIVVDGMTVTADSNGRIVRPNAREESRPIEMYFTPAFNGGSSSVRLSIQITGIPITGEISWMICRSSLGECSCRAGFFYPQNHSPPAASK